MPGACIWIYYQMHRREVREREILSDDEEGKKPMEINIEDIPITENARINIAIASLNLAYRIFSELGYEVPEKINLKKKEVIE